MSIRKLIVFYLIAPVYAFIFRIQVKKYTAIIQKVKKYFDITDFISVADLGCGNGALCYAFKQTGFEVTGVDALSSMIGMAKNNLRDTNIKLIKANILEKLPFENKSFDIVISSYVLHGMNKEDRKILYKEMNRIAKRAVIFHDYNQNRSIFTDIIEWIEGGDYFDFIKHAEAEMKQFFWKLQVIDVDKRAAWYINEIKA